MIRYTATALTEATRPIPLAIGRVSHRRGLRRLSRWWFRVARSWASKPISTPQMLAMQSANAQSPAAYVSALADVLRAVLPWRWWYVITGDPVRAILALGMVDQALQSLVLHRMVTVQEQGPDLSRQPEDPVSLLRQAQRRALYGDEQTRGPSVSLSMVALTVRCALGHAWYYAPGVWPTSDGYAPFAATIVEHAGLQAFDARRRLELADGFALAHVRDPKPVRAALEALAYPSALVH